jgi:hypothetical protein
MCMLPRLRIAPPHHVFELTRLRAEHSLRKPGYPRSKRGSALLLTGSDSRELFSKSRVKIEEGLALSLRVWVSRDVYVTNTLPNVEMPVSPTLFPHHRCACSLCWQRRPQRHSCP